MAATNENTRFEAWVEMAVANAFGPMFSSDDLPDFDYRSHYEDGIPANDPDLRSELLEWNDIDEDEVAEW